MKKISLALAALALGIPAGPLLVSTPALAANANNEFCKDYVASGEDANLNLGECISLLNQFDRGSYNSYAVHWCDYLAENYPDDYELYYGGSKKACILDNS